MALSLQEAFSSLEDPRIERHKRHNLLDIIILTICSVISGAEGWDAIEQFGKDKEEWLKKWITLENGIPSHDCIARVIARIEPTQMTKCFIAWVQGVAELTTGEVVAIDGKTARHSYNRKDKLGAIHMVSAWANQAGLSLGQVKTEAKSNEIPTGHTSQPYRFCWICSKSKVVSSRLTRYPHGALVGCQTDIAEKIVEKQADYVLAVRQPKTSA
ncbi:MAG: ISAs1 family transposase [Methylovulum miyakonense]|uniref:ISAs1 family transposase n=1 Tax=Methylovulum miyakonense TaxID=645578 RepID=UPI003BB5A94E